MLYSVLHGSLVAAALSELSAKLKVVKEMIAAVSARDVYNPTEDTLTSATAISAAAVTAAKRNVSATMLAWMQVCLGAAAYHQL